MRITWHLPKTAKVNVPVKKESVSEQKEEFSFFNGKKINTESQRCGFSHAHNLNSKVKYVMVSPQPANLIFMIGFVHLIWYYLLNGSNIYMMS